MFEHLAIAHLVCHGYHERHDRYRREQCVICQRGSGLFQTVEARVHLYERPQYEVVAFAVYKEQVEEEKEYLRKQYETLRKDREIRDSRVHVREAAGEDYQSRKDSILQYMNQQEQPVLDALGERWIRCEFCGEVKEVSEFVSFGGRGRVNLGRCQGCKDV